MGKDKPLVVGKVNLVLNWYYTDPIRSSLTHFSFKIIHVLNHWCA